MLIYLAANSINNRSYVGATLQTFEARKRQHKYRSQSHSKMKPQPFHKAIMKYGFSSFEWSVLERCRDIAELRNAECKWISFFKSNSREFGYNQTEGGSGTIGMKYSDATREKMSISHIGQKHTMESRMKRSLSLKGRKPSQSAIEASRRRIFTPEQRAAIGAIWRGKKRVISESHLSNIRRAGQRRSEHGIGAKIKPNEAARIWGLRNSGKSFRHIGSLYGVTASAVFYFCQRTPSLCASTP